MTSELHPLEPFLPVGARLLMLGSFPPQRVRWSMDFFYPNLQNDMWRIVGLVFFGDKGYFLTPDANVSTRNGSCVSARRKDWLFTIRPKR